MNVIVEGPDGTGKSTLIDRLTTMRLYVPFRTQAGEGPPKYPREINERALRYLDMKNTIFDRHPCVSQPIYSQLRGKDEDILPSTLLHFYEQDQLFIYCRSTRLTHHLVKSYEDPDHVATVEDKYAALVDAYDKWAVMRANLIYRIGDDAEVVGTFIASHALRRFNKDFDTTEPG